MLLCREDLTAALQEQLQMYDHEMENMREQLRVKEAEHEEDILRLKSQMTAEQRCTFDKFR